MRFELKKTKITLSEVPQKDVPGALLILNKEFKSAFIDVIKEKSTYRLPDGLKSKDIAAIYLRIM